MNATTATTAARHLTREELEAGLDEIRRAPKDDGALELIVRRPAPSEREVLEQAMLDLEQGLVGDTWKARGSRSTPDGSSHPDMQLNIMNARSTALVAQDRDRWPLAGDQLYVDLDLSGAEPAAGHAARGSAPPSSRSPRSRTPAAPSSCQRFGLDAMKFVNSPVGPRAQPARHLRQGGRAGLDPRRRSRQQDLTAAASAAITRRPADHQKPPAPDRRPVPHCPARRWCRGSRRSAGRRAL